MRERFFPLFAEKHQAKHRIKNSQGSHIGMINMSYCCCYQIVRNGVVGDFVYGACFSYLRCKPIPDSIIYWCRIKVSDKEAKRFFAFLNRILGKEVWKYDFIKKPDGMDGGPYVLTESIAKITLQTKHMVHSNMLMHLTLMRMIDEFPKTVCLFLEDYDPNASVAKAWDHFQTVLDKAVKAGMDHNWSGHGPRVGGYADCYGYKPFGFKKFRSLVKRQTPSFAQGYLGYCK